MNCSKYLRRQKDEPAISYGCASLHMHSYKGGTRMKCFRCGARCITEYIKGNLSDKVIAVQKNCTVCDWKSYPVKIPEPI